MKTHQALMVERGYPTINFSVTAGAIYIVRNPLDVAISYAHHAGQPIDLAIDFMNQTDAETPVTDKQVYEVYGSWSQHVLSWTRKPHRAIYVMRYEDMLAEPHKTFGALARHLLFKPSESELADAVDRSSFERLREQEEKDGFRERPEKAIFPRGPDRPVEGSAHAAADPADRRRPSRADAAFRLSAALVLPTARYLTSPPPQGGRDKEQHTVTGLVVTWPESNKRCRSVISTISRSAKSSSQRRKF